MVCLQLGWHLAMVFRRLTFIRLPLNITSDPHRGPNPHHSTQQWIENTLAGHNRNSHNSHVKHQCRKRRVHPLHRDQQKNKTQALKGS